MERVAHMPNPGQRNLLLTKRFAQFFYGRCDSTRPPPSSAPPSGNKPFTFCPLRLENGLLEMKIHRRVARCGRTKIPVKLSPKTLKENETAVEESKQGLKEAKPQLWKIFPPHPNCFPLEER